MFVFMRRKDWMRFLVSAALVMIAIGLWVFHGHKLVGITGQTDQASEGGVDSLESYNLNLYPENCQELAVGQERIINWSNEESPTLIPAHYKMIRLGPETYELRFNIKLRGSAKDKADMSASINQCLRAAEPFSHDVIGRNLVLRPYFDESPEVAGVEPVKVDVATAFGALLINMRKYVVGMPCSSIIHELMHNTGLIDEYDIQKNFEAILSSGQSEKTFDCRPTTPKGPSLMNEPGPLGDQAGINKKLQVERCKCASGRAMAHDKECAGQAPKTGDESLALSACPPGFVTLGTQAFQEWDFLAQKNILSFEPGAQPGILVNLKTIFDPGSPTSLFLKGHVDHVLYPGCGKKSGRYLVCARNEYRTSKEKGGSGCLPFPDSLCRGQEDWRQ